MNADGNTARSRQDEFAVENRITERVIGCAFEVHNALGCGHKEKVYENAMTVLLRRESIPYGQQVSYPVVFMGEQVGMYEADLVVMDRVIVEMKAIAKLEEEHVGQCLNYLKAAMLRVDLLPNFGRPRLEMRRVVFTSDPSVSICAHPRP